MWSGPLHVRERCGCSPGTVDGGSTRTTTRKYWYDGLGRRILTHVTSVGGSGGPPKDLGLWRYWWFDENVAVKTWNYTTDDIVANFDWPHMLRTNDTLHGYGEWFYYGPGPDNLLASWGYKNPQAASTKQHLFLPDWRGSVTQVTDSAGNSLGLSASAYMAFGSESGTSGSATELNPGYNGHESSGGLVYMRNRWYDPNTGRFTQEDPIGFAGGINLYAYVGNNPVSFTDPFGLKVCFKGGKEDVGKLKEGLQDATNTNITLDDDNCVSGFKAREGKGFESLQARLDVLVRSETTYGVQFGDPVGGPGDKLTARNAWFNHGDNAVTIGRNAPASQSYAVSGFLGICHRRAPASLASLMTHELLGHAGYREMYGGRSGELYAVRVQNEYHSAVGEPARCGTW